MMDQHMNDGVSFRYEVDDEPNCAMQSPSSLSEIVRNKDFGYTEVTVAMMEHLLCAIVLGQKIAAIKILRKVMNLGLKDAKDMVENFDDFYGEMDSNRTFPNKFKEFCEYVTEQTNAVLMKEAKGLKEINKSQAEAITELLSKNESLHMDLRTLRQALLWEQNERYLLVKKIEKLTR